MSKSQRGLDLRFQSTWEEAIEKENKLRLKWFVKNQERLIKVANKELTKTVPEEVKEQYKNELIENYQNVERFGKSGPEGPAPIDPKVLKSIMKPVDPAVTKLIYSGENKDGRINYLHERIKVLPEDRYYFPEVSSFEYGWKTWKHAKNMKKSGFGRVEIVRSSFYRRRGVERDPKWYKQPAGYSPTVCVV